MSAELGVPFLAGFLVTAGLAIAGFFPVVPVQGAPQWAAYVAFVLPRVLFALLTRPAARDLHALAVRSEPPPEGQAALPAGAVAEAEPPASAPPDIVPMPGESPTVPDVETRPGRVLARALEAAGVPAGCAFGCAVGVALFWNGVVGIFLGVEVPKALRGNLDWFHLLFLVPFVLTGLAMIGYAVFAGFRWTVALLVGRVAVSAHPLAPRRAVRGPLRPGGCCGSVQSGLRWCAKRSPPRRDEHVDRPAGGGPAPGGRPRAGPAGASAGGRVPGSGRGDALVRGR